MRRQSHAPDWKPKGWRGAAKAVAGEQPPRLLVTTHAAGANRQIALGSIRTRSYSVRRVFTSPAARPFRGAGVHLFGHVRQPGKSTSRVLYSSRACGSSDTIEATTPRCPGSRRHRCGSATLSVPCSRHPSTALQVACPAPYPAGQRPMPAANRLTNME